VKFYLHDAVYLYLTAVNQTLTDGHLNYRDGRLILNKTIGQRFAGMSRPATDFVDKSALLLAYFLFYLLSYLLTRKVYVLDNTKRYTLCSEKTPTHIFFHISMNNV